MTMPPLWSALLAAALLAYLPGAILFHAPTPGRPARAALAADERAFWAVAASLVVSSTAALLLAAVGSYSLARLLVIDALIVVGGILWSRGDLRLPPDAPRVGWSALLPIGLLAWGLYLFSPPGELILGGKDPGVYLNEGIQIAQRGSLVIADDVVAAVPATARDLFFPSRGDPTYYGVRFMGFFLIDPRTGTVVGQFPHLYPVWIAWGYGLGGVTGARWVVSVCALAGLMAVYFAGAALLGRTVAFAGAALLAVNVAEVWFGRYSNAEVGFQALGFAALLALARAEALGSLFFAALAAVLLGLSLFLRLEAILLVGLVAVVTLGLFPSTRETRRSLLVGLGLGTGGAGLYYGTVMRPYGEQLVGFLRNLAPWQLGLLALAAVAVLAVARAGARGGLLRSERLRRWAAELLAALVVLGAGYAWFLRRPGGALAPHDAYALRTFGEYYVSPYGLAAAVTGYVLTVRRLLGRQPATFLALAGFAAMFFYKVRIVPEHFWMARRFLPIILPGTLLMVAAAALYPLVPGAVRRRRGIRAAWIVAGSAFLVGLGYSSWRAARPLRAHIEYAGATARLERLAARFSPEDLLIVESRQASDVHVFALPLAYLHGKQVLVLDAREPDKTAFVRFLAWARRRYRTVFFLGGGGTDLISPDIGVEPVARERFALPEYDSPRNAYPQGVRRKDFDFGLYRFVPPGPRLPTIAVDIGEMDDLHCVRFHARERHGTTGVSFRWSRDESYLTVLLPPTPRALTLWLGADGRPRKAPPAQVAVYLAGRLLGRATVDEPVRPYVFEIPADLAGALAAGDGTGRITITVPTWNPRRLLGVADDRDLGVMVDRIEVHSRR